MTARIAFGHGHLGRRAPDSDGPARDRRGLLSRHAVLVRLEQIEIPELEELVIEAWLDRAPKRLAKDYLDSL